MIRQTIVFAAIRLMSLFHKIKQTLSGWLGRAVMLVAVVVFARLAWVYIAVPSHRSPLVQEDLMWVALGLCCSFAMPLAGFRSCSKVPMVLSPGDFGIGDIRALIRPATAAGLLAKAIGTGALLFLLLPVPFMLCPGMFATMQAKLQAWGLLWLLALFVTTNGILLSIWSSNDRARRRGLQIFWVVVASALAAFIVGPVMEHGVSGLALISDAFRHLYTVFTIVWPLLMLITILQAVLIVAFAHLALPAWAASMRLLTNILDLAGSQDADGALALVQDSRTTSRSFPQCFTGPRAFIWRAHVEAGRRKTGRALIIRGIAGFALSLAMGRLAGSLWWLAFLIIAGFEASLCVQDGAMREAKYPFLSFGSGTLLTRCAWACLLPCLHMVMMTTISTVALALCPIRPEFVGLAFGCGIGWSVFASASSCAGAIARFKESNSWMSKGIMQLVSIGGFIILVFGVSISRFCGFWGSLALPLPLFALISWAILYLAISNRQSPTHVIAHLGRKEGDAIS
jgi:hypothetical protein